MTISSRITITSSGCAAPPARPAICAASGRRRQSVRRRARQNEYPNKPLIMSQAGVIFTKAAARPRLSSVPDTVVELQRALHQFRRTSDRPMPVLRALRIFRLRVQRQGEPARLRAAGADGRTEIRAAHAGLCRADLIYDKAAKKVRGVVYIDRHTGEELEQPAELVMLCAYPFNNALLLLDRRHRRALRSRRPARAWSARTTATRPRRTCMMFVEDEINPFIGTGVSPAAIDDFQADNFDHGGLGFFGGGFISPSVSGGRPIQVRAVPPGTPRWGSAWKEATARWYNHCVPAQLPRHQLRPPQQLSRPRSDLQGRDRPAADPHDLQLHRQRLQDVGLPDREGGAASRAPPTPRSSATRGRAAATTAPATAAPRTTPAAPSWAPIRRTSVAQSLPAVLGGEQPVRHGRRGVPAESRPQSDRHHRRADLLVGEGDHDAVSQGAGAAGARRNDAESRLDVSGRFYRARQMKTRCCTGRSVVGGQIHLKPSSSTIARSLADSSLRQSSAPR